MNIDQHQARYRHEYTPPEYHAEEVFLTFSLYPDHTRVVSRTRYRANQESSEFSGKLVLNGEFLHLLEIRLDGRLLAEQEYSRTDRELTVIPGKNSFELEVVTSIDPAANTALEGLYCSNGNYCTQCEPEGFRRMTYFLDRPDVLARFTTRIEGDSALHPVLLSNGNLVETGDLDNGRHYAVWQDPFPKPCYLFALVAGTLVHVEDTFTTMSGRGWFCRSMSRSATATAAGMPCAHSKKPCAGTRRPSGWNTIWTSS